MTSISLVKFMKHKLVILAFNVVNPNVAAFTMTSFAVKMAFQLMMEKMARGGGMIKTRQILATSVLLILQSNTDEDKTKVELAIRQALAASEKKAKANIDLSVRTRQMRDAAITTVQVGIARRKEKSQERMRMGGKVMEKRLKKKKETNVKWMTKANGMMGYDGARSMGMGGGQFNKKGYLTTGARSIGMGVVCLKDDRVVRCENHNLSDKNKNMLYGSGGSTRITQRDAPRQVFGNLTNSAINV
jgi:hypothetical protein